MNNIAVIIGNGKSREEIDLNELVGQAPLYGCNALYRDFKKADYLVAMDDGMIEEIQTRLPLKGTQAIFPPEEERYELNGSGRRNNAGMLAMHYAIKNGHNFLYCIGIDFFLRNELQVSNVYDGTDNYGMETRTSAMANLKRLQYFEWYANQNPDVIFCIVYPDDVDIKGVAAKNVLGMKMSTFLRKVRE